jgi:predicted O-methyltransferase YrrM
VDVTYPELALHPRPLSGVRYPHPSLEDTYQPGTTEPWIAQLVSSLLAASGARTVLETGGFQGTTSAWLALTLERVGDGQLFVAEIDTERAHAIQRRLDALPLHTTDYYVVNEDVLNVIRSFNDECIDFVWLDDDHQQPHVAAEIEALWPKMSRGGLIVLHDVYGSCDLQAVVKRFGGYSIDLPRLGPAGGIGVIQVL